MAGRELHSRVVAVLKVALPLVALALLLGLFVGPPTEEQPGGGLVFAPGDVDARGSGLAIRNPTFDGTTRGDDRFHFTATLVEPDAAPPQRAAITGPAGDFALAGGPTLTLNADTGDLDLPTQRLDLLGDVRVSSSDGYRIRSERMTLDLRAGSLIADERVTSAGPLGTIDSGSLRIAPAAETGEARRFSFANGVRLVYDPPNP